MAPKLTRVKLNMKFFLSSHSQLIHHAVFSILENDTTIQAWNLEVIIDSLFHSIEIQPIVLTTYLLHLSYLFSHHCHYLDIFPPGPFNNFQNISLQPSSATLCPLSSPTLHVAIRVIFLSCKCYHIFDMALTGLHPRDPPYLPSCLWTPKDQYFICWNQLIKKYFLNTFYMPKIVLGLVDDIKEV